MTALKKLHKGFHHPTAENFIKMLEPALQKELGPGKDYEESRKLVIICGFAVVIYGFAIGIYGFTVVIHDFAVYGFAVVIYDFEVVISHLWFGGCHLWF